MFLLSITTSMLVLIVSIDFPLGLHFQRAPLETWLCLITARPIGFFHFGPTLQWAGLAYTPLGGAARKNTVMLVTSYNLNWLQDRYYFTNFYFGSGLVPASFFS